MAKVAIVATAVTPSLKILAEFLMQQKQDVLVVTSKNQSQALPAHWRVITPFKKWNLSETVRALPALLAENCDIWHFVFGDKEDQPRRAHWVLATVIHSLPRKIIAGSFDHWTHVEGLFAPTLLRNLDLALFSKRSLLMRTKRHFPLPDHTLTEVLPPLSEDFHQSRTMPSSEALRLTEALGHYLILPELGVAPNWIHQSPLPLLILNKPPVRPLKSKRIFYLESVSEADRDHFIQKSLALCLLFGDHSPTELQAFHQWSEQFQRPLIVTSQQTEEFPGLCWHQKSGWVVDNASEGLKDLLTKNPTLSLPVPFQSYPHRDLVDSTLNQLVRLYQKSYTLRWT